MSTTSKTRAVSADSMKAYEYEVCGGEVVEHGKPHWPNMLTFTFTRSHAWDMVKEVLRQLEGDAETIHLVSCGELRRDEESEDAT